MHTCRDICIETIQFVDIGGIVFSTTVSNTVTTVEIHASVQLTSITRTSTDTYMKGWGKRWIWWHLHFLRYRKWGFEIILCIKGFRSCVKSFSLDTISFYIYSSRGCRHPLDTLLSWNPTACSFWHPLCIPTIDWGVHFCCIDCVIRAPKDTSKYINSQQPHLHQLHVTHPIHGQKQHQAGK